MQAAAAEVVETEGLSADGGRVCGALPEQIRRKAQRRQCKIDVIQEEFKKI